jgi:Flp pilus assembly protein TadD
MSSSSNEPHPKQVASLLALAAQLLSARRPADAVAPLREAALLQPSDLLIQHDLGLACLEVGLVPEAINAFQRAVSLDPTNALAQGLLGNVQLRSPGEGETERRDTQVV